VEVVASLSQGRTAAAQCGLFTHKSVPVIIEPPCIMDTALFWLLLTIYVLLHSILFLSLKKKLLLWTKHLVWKSVKSREVNIFCFALPGHERKTDKVFVW